MLIGNAIMSGSSFYVACFFVTLSALVATAWYGASPHDTASVHASAATR